MHLDISQVTLFLLLILCQTYLLRTASIHHSFRKKRGLLTRTGLCPSPNENYRLKDTRLNFFGISYQLPGDENPPCTLNECTVDDQCTGDQKCCRNTCGAYVCTESVRDPHPCDMFPCPATKICKVHRVRCVDPDCPDMLAISRPICVQSGPTYEVGKRNNIPRPNILSRRQQTRTSLSHSKMPADDVRYEPEKPYYQAASGKR